jgi:hypothetical protein
MADDSGTTATARRPRNNVSPLSLKDFSALFEISPHLLVDPYVGAVERLYATRFQPCESSSSSDAEVDDAVQPSTAVNGQTATSPRSRSTNLGIVTRRTSEIEGGRQAYVIDSRSNTVPKRNGKTDVGSGGDKGRKERKQAKVERDTNGTEQQLAAGNWSKANGANQAHPPSLALRSQLFPELDTQSDPPLPSTPSLGTTTDDGAGSDSDRSAAGGAEGGKRKAHGHGGHGREQQQRQQQPDKITNGRRDSWKLDVVNPVRLLDGVLEG